ncbi:hypothetical protein BDF19DRAFT_443071 [Syncephalis fuscata]|nr:hypothetical protein BDF19DRAFT_443071 [Syncephalis fuscata]
MALYRLIKTKRIITKQQTIIYVSALCAAILCASGFALKLNSLAYKWISIFTNIFIYIGFYTLLLLWQSIAISLQNSRQLRLLRYGIIISFVITIIDQTLNIIPEFISAPTIQSTLKIIAISLILSTQSVIIITFIYYGNTIRCKQALSLVTKLCAIFSLGYLMILTANIMILGKTWRYGAEAELINAIIFKASYIVRIGALLFVINLRSRSDSQCKDKVVIRVNNKKDATISVQSTHNKNITFASALMSSNIDPNIRPIIDDNTYYSSTITYNRVNK